MKAHKQELVQSLLDALAPLLSTIAPAGQKPPKPVLKTVRQLADQLARLQARQAKQAAKATDFSPKQAKQKLTDELVAVLDAHFAEEGLDAKANTVLTETATELAGKLTKLRSKQAQKQSKELAKAAPEEPEKLVEAPARKRNSRRLAS